MIIPCLNGSLPAVIAFRPISTTALAVFPGSIWEGNLASFTSDSGWFCRAEGERCRLSHFQPSLAIP